MGINRPHRGLGGFNPSEGMPARAGEERHTASAYQKPHHQITKGFSLPGWPFSRSAPGGVLEGGGRDRSASSFRTSKAFFLLSSPSPHSFTHLSVLLTHLPRHTQTATGQSHTGQEASTKWKEERMDRWRGRCRELQDWITSGHYLINT